MSYQYGLGPHSRLDFGINFHGGLSSNSSHLSGRGSIYYQHVWNIKGGLNWFLGAGVNYSFARTNIPSYAAFYDRFALGPQVGLEYDFNVHNVPLVLGMDWRPGLGFPSANPGAFSTSNDFGISLRYTF